MTLDAGVTGSEQKAEKPRGAPIISGAVRVSSRLIVQVT
jgi:hypothetical protein